MSVSTATLTWFDCYMANSRLRPRLWLPILLGVPLLTLLIPLPFLSRCETTTTHICVNCGIRRSLYSTRLVGVSPTASETETLQPTELSRWFASHIAENCRHSWRFNHSTNHTFACIAGLRLWTYSASAASSVTPSLVYFDDDARTEVERRLLESPEACRRYIQARLSNGD